VLKVVAKRLGFVGPVLIIVLIAIFLLQAALPGDPATVIAGPEASPSQIAVVRQTLGLDKPIYTQFADFIGNAVQGKFGTSYASGRPVWTVIMDALPVTGSLALVAIVLTLLIGVPLGILAALKKGSLVDRAVSAVCAVAIAVPPFVFGFVLVILLALKSPVFPATGYSKFSTGLPWIEHLVLPGLAFALPLSAEVARQVRGSFADTLELDFIRTARASGLLPRAVVGKHAAKTAAIPVITVFGLQAGRLLGGAIVVEQVFGIPGIGSLAYQSVLGRDLPLIRGIVIITALIVIIVNLLVDLTSAVLNPRLRS
jgi:peptide/nickel transport system permease protein